MAHDPHRARRVRRRGNARIRADRRDHPRVRREPRAAGLRAGDRAAAHNGRWHGVLHAVRAPEPGLPRRKVRGAAGRAWRTDRHAGHARRQRRMDAAPAPAGASPTTSASGTTFRAWPRRASARCGGASPPIPTSLPESRRTRFHARRRPRRSRLRAAASSSAATSASHTANRCAPCAAGVSTSTTTRGAATSMRTTTCRTWGIATRASCARRTSRWPCSTPTRAM